jgi:phosphoglycolate phosphatase
VNTDGTVNEDGTATYTPPIRLACLDMAGTTVCDDGAVLAAFRCALDALGVVGEAERGRMTEYVVATMGESKITVLRALFPGDEERARRGNEAFEAAYAKRIAAAKPIPGAVETFEALHAAGVRIALTTGFSRATADALLDHLGWRPLIDLSLTPQEVGGFGRPHPDLVLAAAARLADGESAAVAVAGDTVGDIRSGLAAGARIVAGVLTGAHDRDRLRAAGATHVLDSVAQLTALFPDTGSPSTTAHP